MGEVKQIMEVSITDGLEEKVFDADSLMVKIRPSLGGEYELEMYAGANGLHIICDDHKLEVLEQSFPEIKGSVFIFLNWKAETLPYREDEGISHH